MEEFPIQSMCLCEEVELKEGTKGYVYGKGGAPKWFRSQVLVYLDLDPQLKDAGSGL